MKATITKSEYLQLTGLLVLAERHDNALESIVSAMVEITEEADAKMGHCADYAYGGHKSRDVDELLRKLGITVADAPAEAGGQ